MDRRNVDIMVAEMSRTKTVFSVGITCRCSTFLVHYAYLLQLTCSARLLIRLWSSRPQSHSESSLKQLLWAMESVGAALGAKTVVLRALAQNQSQFSSD